MLVLFLSHQYVSAADFIEVEREGGKPAELQEIFRTSYPFLHVVCMLSRSGLSDSLPPYGL